MENDQSSQTSSQAELVEAQRNLEGRFESLNSELTELKSLLHTLVQQNAASKTNLNEEPRQRRYYTTSTDMVTGVPELRSRSTDRRHYEDSDDDHYNHSNQGSSGSNPETDVLLTAINQLPQRIQKSSTGKLLQTHVPNFKGQQDKYNEFEHLLMNHLRPISNKLTEEEKIHFFQSLLRDEAIEFWQTITITTTTTLADILSTFRKEFAKDDLKEVARYRWNEAKYDPATESFSDFVKNLKKIAKQAFGTEADKCIQMFLFGKLPVDIQQELTMANKEDSSPEDIKTYLQRKYQYQQVLTAPPPVQPFNQITTGGYVPPTNNQQQSQPKQHPEQQPQKKFEGKCFYCGKMGHRKHERRSKLRDEANGIVKPDAIPRNSTAPTDKKYNPKLVCQICGYTGHSARDCRHRFPKESSNPYGKIPYQKADTEESKERRRDLKKQQRPINQLAAAPADDRENTSSSEEEQDFQ